MGRVAVIYISAAAQINAALQQTKMAVTVAFKGVVNKILSNYGV